MAAVHQVKPGIAEIAGEADLRRILGDLDDAKVLEILAISPTAAEVEEAASWASGEGDRIDRAGHHLVGNVARVFEILVREADESNHRS